jgi:hypothetical protein
VATNLRKQLIAIFQTRKQWESMRSKRLAMEEAQERVCDLRTHITAQEQFIQGLIDIIVSRADRNDRRPGVEQGETKERLEA